MHAQRRRKLQDSATVLAQVRVRLALANDGDDEAAARALEADSEIPPAPRRGDDDEYTDDEQTFEAESDDERAGSPPRRVLGENRKARRPGDEDLKWVAH